MTVASEKLDPIQRLFVDITTDVLCQTNSGVLRLNIYTIINCCPARYKDVSSLSKEDRGLSTLPLNVSLAYHRLWKAVL